MNGYGDKRVMRISHQALKTLAGLEGLKPGLLSPLAGLEPGPGRPDREVGEEMAAWLQGMDGSWEWAAPALLDPQRTAALLYADPDRPRIGQYVFPDPDGAGPAFNAAINKEGIELSGPWSMGEVRMAMLEMFSLESVADLPPVRLDLTLRQFLCLAAIVDAYRVSRLVRGLTRVGGITEGLSIPEVVEAWNSGTSEPDPEWSVSMLSLLSPDPLPAAFENEIPAVMAELVGAGLLQKVDLGGKQDYYAPRSALWKLCVESSRSGTVFGLVTRTLDGPDRVEASILCGWRSAEGVWLVDPASGGETTLLQVGPYLFMDFLADLMTEKEKEPPGAAFHMETRYTRDALVSRLRAMPAGAQTGMEPGEATAEGRAPVKRRFCYNCGNELREGLSFCNKCGKPASRSHVTCAACGAQVEEGLKFCNACGKPIQQEVPKLKFCPKCGSRLQEGLRFCSKCGRPV